jgi:prepilin-type N-terminal cleavage/methylation domain-containing protein
MKVCRTGHFALLPQGAVKHGYSLVEISLALLVIAVGFLAAMALLPEGLNQARRSVQEAETSEFAEFVFSSLALEASDTNVSWSGAFWTPMTLMRSHALELANQPLVRVLPSVDTITNSWWIPNFYADAAWRLSQHRVASFTYTLTIGDVPQRGSRYARLEVWPGEFAVKPGWKGKIFYREYLPSHTK